MDIVNEEISFRSNEVKESVMNFSEKPFSFHLEVYDGTGADEQSYQDDSSGLEIDTDVDTRKTITPGHRSRNKKRKRDDLIEHNVDKQYSSYDEDLPDGPSVSDPIVDEIERQLDAKAAKSNLTVLNVKNILKQVITNEHVLSMVRNSVKDKTDFRGSNVTDYLDDVPLPKLTRSKTKELLATQPEIAWPMTPVKRPGVSSECQVLIEKDLPEDSSDEEYQPNENDLINDYDWEFNSEPATPGSTTSGSMTPRPPSNLDCSTQTSWTDDGAFRIPAENIGQRTRSKFSLSDTALETIEKAFVPPDITTDMYDVECDDEDWRDFLNKFTEPLRSNANDTIDDDDEADPEYNLMADEEFQEAVDKEELRMDKGVKVSKKELNLLVAELFDMYEDVEPSLRHRDNPEAIAEVATITPPDVTEPPDECMEEDPTTFTPNQIELLNHQMRKHVQLLAQHFVQTYEHPVLGKIAPEFKEQLVTLQCLSSNNSQSFFRAANLDWALQLVHDWEDVMLPGSEVAAQIKDFMVKEINTATTFRDKKRKYVCRFPLEMLDLISNSKAIIFPLLLPHIPFRCDGFYRTDLFLSEAHLIAIGLEQFTPYVKEKKSVFLSKYELEDVVTLIHEQLIPAHDHKYICAQIRKTRKIKDDKVKENPIKFYYEKGKAPGYEHFVVAFSVNDLKVLSKQPPELLPEAWRDHVFPGIKLKDSVQAVLGKETPLRQAFHFVNV